MKLFPTVTQEHLWKYETHKYTRNAPVERACFRKEIKLPRWEISHEFPAF